MILKPTRRLVLAGGAAGVAMPFVARAQSAYKPEYKLSVVGNRPIPLSEGAFRWAELVNEKSQGRINMKVYPGSQLVGGDQTRELVAMRQGVIDMLVSSTINIAPQIREMNLFSLPFLMPDHKAFDALITGEVRKELDATLAARDSMVLAWGENGFRELSNSKRPVRKPDDLKGMKIRYAAGPIFADIFNALGANPLQMSFADLQPALSTGAVDGQENPINLFLAFKMETLAQKYLTIWNYVADAGIFHLGKAVWDTFSPQDKDIVKEAAEQAAKEQIASTRKGLGAGGDRSSIQELEKRGVQVAELTPEEKDAFREPTKVVFDKWAQTAGLDLVKKAQEAIEKR
jgi:tripartite ATP-independent transporter DctP family solute receptor